MKKGQGNKGDICFAIDDYPSLALAVDARDHHLFFRFLQHGFFVVAQTGESVKSMLCDRFGLEQDYAVNRIKTIFLNGKPVDDMEKALISDGCCLALSAAMPGLVGATFRSGGVLSTFRAAISYRPEKCEESQSNQCGVYLKLFNLLVPEMGPKFLERGIFVHKSYLEEFIGEEGPNFANRCGSIVLDDKETSVEKLVRNGISDTKEFVRLKVVIRKDF